MTTATAKSPSTELAELEQRVAKARAKAREARDEKDTWEREVPELRACAEGLDPDSTEGRKVRAEIMAREQSRIHSVGPKAEALQAVIEPFHVLDEELQRFKRARVRERLDEINPDLAVADLIAAFEALAAATETYRAVVTEVRAVVLDTPGMDGQDYGQDPRVEEWAALAAGALETEITAPGLSPLGSWKADNHG